MKSKLLFRMLPGLVFLMIIMSLAGCKVEEIVYDENPFIKTRNHLHFQGLQQSNPSINLSDSLLLEAKASGDSLTFQWSASGGTLVANGQRAVFYPDTTGLYQISCLASDMYDNSETKQAEVLVVMELVFSGISATDTLLPPGIPVMLRALASGEELEFIWAASGGVINGNGAEVEFTANTTGFFTVSCVVKDKHNEVASQELQLEATDNLIFKKLEATKTVIDPYEVSWITAEAYGQGLTYEWNAEPMGVLLGYEGKVRFSNCCANVHVISCKITDNKGNSQTRQVTITIVE